MQSNSPFTSSTASSSQSTAPVAGPATAPVDLGGMISQHRCNYVWYLVWGVGLFGLAAFLFLNPMMRNDSNNDIFRILSILAGIGCIAYGIYQMKGCAYCYEEGLVLERGSKQETVRWDGLESITQQITRHYTNGIYTHTSHVYNLLGKDGKKYKLNDSYKGVENLGEYIQKQLAAIKFPLYLEDFKAGRPVRFGDLVFDANGITRGKTSVAWHEFKSVDFKNGFLRVHKENEGMKAKLLTGGSIVIQVSNLPNFYTLVLFIQSLPKYSAMD